jgi:hypothetical protein
MDHLMGFNNHNKNTFYFIYTMDSSFCLLTISMAQMNSALTCQYNYLIYPLLTNSIITSIFLSLAISSIITSLLHVPFILPHFNLVINPIIFISKSIRYCIYITFLEFFF